MSRYVRKQIIIVLVFLIILAIIGGGIYFLFIKQKLPSCSDKIQNQGEEGVDCGGPCPLCSWQLQKDIEVIFSEAIETQEGYVDLVAKIKNPNQDFGAKSFSYAFNLYDSTESLINSREGNSYILPQETKYIIEQKALVSSEISNVEFKVIDTDWQELSDYEEPEFLIKNPEFTQSENSGLLSGTLENRSNYDFDKVDIWAVLFDKESKTLGAGKIELRTVLSKENRYFEISWLFPIKGEVESTEIKAKTNVFLDENFMKRHDEREKFQEY